MMTLSRLLLLFVASRLLYLVLIEPGSLLVQPYDELYVGTIAQELATGLKMPFTEYRTNNYMLGTLVMGGLASVFFRLFGPTLFALKLALLFWYWTIQRCAGERVARYFAVLFCFSPPLLTAYSVAAPGGHGESILFSALTVFLLFKMLSEEQSPRAYPVLLGLTSGVGLWFDYIYGLTLLALLGLWLWHNKGMLRRLRFAWFALGFVVSFAPWIVINVQTHFAGLVIYGENVWEHFGLVYLWDGLAHPQRLALVEFLRTIASDDSWNLYRRGVNLLYSLLYLGPLLTAGVLWLKTVRSEPAEANYRGRGPREMCPSRTHPTRPTLVGFATLYIIVFALAVQFSDFKDTQYHLPAYPFLFLFVALALAYCQDRFPRVQRQIQIIFLASVVVLGLGTHAPLMSLDRPGFAFSAKGYSYALMPGHYWNNHAPAGSGKREFLLELVQRPFLSDILPKLSSDDQRELSRTIALMLADTAPLNGQAEDFDRIERVVPPGFDRYFYYQVGVTAMGRHPHELPQAVAAVEFLRHRSAAAHHLALVGIYHMWGVFPESLVNTTASVAQELLPHYWRALGHLLGHWAGRSWDDTEQSLSLLNAHLHVFVPTLEPSAQRPFLQGVGELLFHHLIMGPTKPLVPAAELERFPLAYQEGLLEGWGMTLAEDELFPPLPWKGQESPYWTASTKGFSSRSLVSIQQGKAQFEALFEGPAPSALAPPLSR